MTLTLGPKTLVPVGAAAAFLIALLTVCWPLVTAFRDVSYNTNANGNAIKQQREEYKALIEQQREETRELKEEYQTAIGKIEVKLDKMATREDVRLFLESAMAQALVGVARDNQTLRLEIGKEIEQLRGRVQILENSGRDRE